VRWPLWLYSYKQGFLKENFRYPVWTCRDPIFSNSGDPIFNSGDPNRFPKTPYKNLLKPTSVLHFFCYQLKLDSRSCVKSVYSEADIMVLTFNCLIFCGVYLSYIYAESNRSRIACVMLLLESDWKFAKYYWIRCKRQSESAYVCWAPEMVG